MPRYIDADKLVDWCNETFQAQSTQVGKEYVTDFLTAVFSCTTADVVPRSECERCGEKARETIESLQGQIANAKAEVEGYRHNWQKIHDSYTADCLEHYNKGRGEVAREIFEEIESISSDFPLYGNINTVIFSERDLAYLKKKYTEGG